MEREPPRPSPNRACRHRFWVPAGGRALDYHHPGGQLLLRPPETGRTEAARKYRGREEWLKPGGSWNTCFIP